MTLSPGFQPLTDHPEVIDAFGHLHRPYIDLVIETHNRYLVASLEFRDRTLWHQQRPFLDHRLSTNPGELSGPENVTGVGEESGHLDRTGPHIHLAVRKGKGTLVRMDAPIRKNQIERHLLSASILHVSQVILLAHRDIDFDRVNGRNSRQLLDGSGTDKVTDLRLRDAGNAGNG